MKTCSCPLCSKGNYDPSEFIVDLSELKRERPVGISGLMRVKNGARWLALSIDTCIDALDELIICYQESTDETAAIVEQKRQQYPDKIKAYFYAPPVYADFLSEEDFWHAYHLPKDSIHLLSNYYNYTLSKATYQYAMKIDADQIYFTDRLSELCDVYRGIGVYKYSLKGCMAYYFGRIFFRLSRFYWAVRIIDKFPFGGDLMKFYSSYLYRLVYKTKMSVSLSGINLYKGGEKWRIPVFTEGSKCPLVFNGCADLFVFEVSDQCFYTPSYQSPKKSDQSNNIMWNSGYTVYRIMERFHCGSKMIVHGGFFWFHMKFADISEFDKKSISLRTFYDDFRNMKINDLFKCGLIKNHRYHFMPHLFFFKYDKTIPNPNKIIGDL